MVGVYPEESGVLVLAEYVHDRQPCTCEPTGHVVVGYAGDDAGTPVKRTTFWHGVGIDPDKPPVASLLRICRHTVHKMSTVFA